MLDAIALITRSAEVDTHPFGSVYTALYVPIPFTVIGDNTGPDTPEIVLPFNDHTKEPPVGFTVAVMLVDWLGNKAASGEAVRAIEGSGFTYKLAWLDVTTVQRPVSITRKLLVFMLTVVPVTV